MKSFKQTLGEDVQPGYAPKEISFGGYTTKNLHHSADAAQAFASTIEKVKRGEIKDKEGVLHALKATDAYMKINDMHLEQGKAPDEAELESWRNAHIEARNHLNKIGEFMHHMDYWHNHEHEIQDMETKYTPETAGREMADSYEPQGDQLDEATRFATAMKSAIAAHERGDHKRAKYHLDNAKTARLSLKSTEYAKHKDLMDKYKEMAAAHKDISEELGDTNLLEYEGDAKKSDQDHDPAEYKRYHKMFHNAWHHGYMNSNGGQTAVNAAANVARGYQSSDKAPRSHRNALEKARKDVVLNKGAALKEELTDKTIRPTDKIKVARVIADMLGVEKAESMTPEAAINTGLRKIKSKRMTPELVGVLHKMLKLAQEVGVKVDMSLAPAAVKEEAKPVEEAEGVIASDILRLKDFIELQRASEGKAKVGHSHHPVKSAGEDEEDQIRRMKVKYKTEEVSVDEAVGYDTSGQQERAMKAKQKAQMILRHAKEKEALVTRHHMQKQTLTREESDINEDEVETADYKVDKAGKKYRAHKIKVEDTQLDELSNDTLASYKKKAAADASAADKEGDFARGNKRFSGIVKATNKQFDNDKKLREELADQDFEVLDLSDDELDAMVNDIDFDDMVDHLDDDEVTMVDADTGEEVEDEDPINEESLMEVLSRSERMKARIRFMRTKSKRERRIQVALKRRADSKTLNKRARRMAITLLKQRLMKKPVSQMTVPEKERAERMVQQRRKVIDRLAMRMIPRLRRIESDRLSGSKQSQPSSGVSV